MKDFRHKLELEIAITLAMQEKDVIISLVSIFFCYLISKYQMVHYIAQNIFFWVSKFVLRMRFKGEKVLIIITILITIKLSKYFQQ